MMLEIDQVLGYQARWVGEEGDLVIAGISEDDMTEAELQSSDQAVTVFTEKQVVDILENYNGMMTNWRQQG